MLNERRIILLIIFITGLVLNAQAARVYGTVYEWSDFNNPLKNTIVEIEVNNTRLQYKIATDGTYTFDVSPGSYIIKAKYYNNNIMEFSGEEKFQIERPDESRNLDILLFPPTDPEYEYLGDINLTGEIDQKETDPGNYIVILLAGIIIFIIVFLYFRKTNKKSDIVIEARPHASESISVTDRNSIDLPEDLRVLYDIILKKGGRTTQKELRKEVAYGEAKVSLMIADLEDRGFIKKIKKGRSNIIIAENKN